MPPSRSQFTLGQWANLIFLCAVIFDALRVSVSSAVYVLLGVLLLCLNGRANAISDDVGRVAYRFFTLIGCGLAYGAYFYFCPDPGAVAAGFALLSIYSVVLVASLWGAVVNRPGRPFPPGDESCGPIVLAGRSSDARKSPSPPVAPGFANPE